MKKPALHIVLYSNFEGFCTDLTEARRMVDGFESITAQYPEAVWTHMFNPAHLRGPAEKRKCAEVFIPYLQSLSKRFPGTEVGLHTHLYYSMVEALGVKPRSHPFVGLPANKANKPRPFEKDGGYDVLLTAYSDQERATIIERCCAAFQEAGLGRPTTFCSGYSATTPKMNALLEQKGFTAHFGGQVIPAGFPGVSHASCWYQQLEWDENITPLSRPYRVGKRSILPPKKRDPLMKRLVEIPLNTDQDIRPLYLHRQLISRKNVLDCHYEMVRVSGRSSCVSLGIHDVYAGDGTKPNLVIDEMLANLEHARKISERGDVPVRYSTAAQVSHSVFTQPDLW